MRQTTSNYLKVKILYLKLQQRELLKRYEKQKRRDSFVKKHSKAILALSMDGWPRLKEMRDKVKWVDLVYKAKIGGIYAIGTANCDVIAQLHRLAKATNN
jgi:hypothetical protein